MSTPPVSKSQWLSTQLQPLACELGLLQGPHGSAQWTSGSLQVVAAVHGPMAAKSPAHEQAHCAQVSVLVNLAGATTANAARELDDWLASILRPAIQIGMYPRTVIQIVVHANVNNASFKAAAVHASCMALIDAGVALNYLPCAIVVGVEDKTSFYLDPSETSIVDSDLSCIVLVASEANAILGTSTTGLLAISTVDLLQMCGPVLERSVQAIRAFVQLVVEQKTTRQSQTLWAE
jgi:ribonuclease PH